MLDSKAFKEAFQKIPEDIINLSSDELLTSFKPTKVDYALRSAFWNEFRLASLNSEKIILKRVYVGICTYQHFYHNVLNNPYKLAWLIQPYADYEKEIEPLIMKSVERLNDILNLPIIDDKNKVDSKAAKVLLDAIKLVDSKMQTSQVEKPESKKPSSSEIMKKYKESLIARGDDSHISKNLLID